MSALSSARVVRASRVISSAMASTSSSRARPSSSSSSLKTFVDTHAHMDAVLQKLDIERVDEYFAAVEREEESESAQARLEACITIGCSERSFESTAALSREDSRVYSAFGVHPLSAREWPNAEARVRELARNEPRCVAIGECGLDYHRIPEDEDVEAYKQRQ
jgi:TatD DNase family protein